MIIERDLSREEIGLIWEIDRSEIIENIYYPGKGGLVLRPEYYNTELFELEPEDIHLECAL